MIPQPGPPRAAPSRAALRVLRRLALAGSTFGAIGSAFTVATISYEVHRRIQVAEHLVDQKRTFKSTCPNYDSTARGTTVARMMEAAETGEFLGLESMKNRDPIPGKETIADREQDSSLQGNQRMDTVEPFASNHISPNLFNDYIPSTYSTSPVRSKDHTTVHTRVNQPSPVRPQAIHHDRRNFRDDNRGVFFRSISNFGPRVGQELPERTLARVDRLLGHDKPIEAAQLFLHACKTWSKNLPESATGLSVRLLYANLKTDNVFIANNLFHWMEGNNSVSKDVWEAVIRGLGRRWSVESLAKVYTNYAEKFELAYSLRDLVLRALIDSFRLGEARKLVFTYMTEDPDCGLSAIYIGGLWKKTRNLDLVETQFKRILQSLKDSEIPVSDKLFNPLLKAYIESGHNETAEMLVRQMNSEYNLPLRIRPLGLVAYGKALKCDWDGVHQSLQQITDLGLSKKSQKWFAKIFDRIFLEYFLGHSGQEIRDFVFRAINDYHLVLDKVLMEHVVKAYIQKGNTTMALELLETAEKRAWKVSLESDHFMNMLREHRLSCETSSVGLWQMFRSSQQNSRVGVSKRILGFDKNSFPHEDVYRLPWSGEPTRWWKKATSMPTASRQIDHFPALHKQMVQSMHAGRMEDAVDMFYVAKKDGKVMKREHVELAVIASIMHHGFVDQARLILEGEQKGTTGSNKPQVSNSLWEVLQSDTIGESEVLKMAVFNFYQILEQQLLPIKHHMVVSCCTSLIRRRKMKPAIELIRAVNKSKYGQMVPFDAAAVKIIARASSFDGNVRGVRWVIFTALNRPSALTRDVVVQIYRAIENLHRRSIFPSAQAEETFRQETSYLQLLAELVDRKEERVNRIKDRKPSSPLKWTVEALNSKNGQTLISEEQESAISKTVETWSERVELENAFDPDFAEEPADTGFQDLSSSPSEDDSSLHAAQAK